MISVTIDINGRVIHFRSAVNQGKQGLDEWGLYKYKLDNGDIIVHRRRDGAIPLAIEMLRTLEAEE